MHRRRGCQQGTERERAGQQARASCRHEGDTKNEQKMRRVSQHSGASCSWVKKTGESTGAGGGKCAEGEGDARQRKSAVTQARTNAGDIGEREATKSRGGTRREGRGKGGARATRRATAMPREKRRKKGNDSAVA